MPYHPHCYSCDCCPRHVVPSANRAGVDQFYRANGLHGDRCCDPCHRPYRHHGAGHHGYHHRPHGGHGHHRGYGRRGCGYGCGPRPCHHYWGPVCLDDRYGCGYH